VPSLPFAELMGIQIIETSPEKVIAEMLARDELCTVPAVPHGGAIMALADTLGAAGDGGQSARGRWNHDHRKQDKLSRPCACRVHSSRRMHAHPSRKKDYGLADPGVDRRGPVGCGRYADSARTVKDSAIGQAAGFREVDHGINAQS